MGARRTPNDYWSTIFICIAYAKLGWDVYSHVRLVQPLVCISSCLIYFSAIRASQCQGCHGCCRPPYYQSGHVRFFRRSCNLPSGHQDITSSRFRFPKATQIYEALNFYGRNIISTEGEEWKKYRKICAPAFNDVSGSYIPFVDHTWLMTPTEKQRIGLGWERQDCRSHVQRPLEECRCHGCEQLRWYHFASMPFTNDVNLSDISNSLQIALFVIGSAGSFSPNNVLPFLLIF